MAFCSIGTLAGDVLRKTTKRAAAANSAAKIEGESTGEDTANSPTLYADAPAPSDLNENRPRPGGDKPGPGGISKHRMVHGLRVIDGKCEPMLPRQSVFPARGIGSHLTLIEGGHHRTRLPSVVQHSGTDL